MKTKITLSLTIALAMSLSTVFGQAKGFKIGIKGGANLSSLTMGDFLTTRYNANGVPVLNVNGQVIKDNLRASFDTKTGFAGGIFAKFGRNIYVQPELMVSHKKGGFEILRNAGTDKSFIEEVPLNLTTIDVPVMVGLKGGPFRINAGPMASFTVGENQKIKDALQQYSSAPLGQTLSNAIWGYQAGFGLDLLGMSIDVRREGMLSDLTSIQLGNAVPFKQKLASWQVTVGMKIL